MYNILDFLYVKLLGNLASPIALDLVLSTELTCHAKLVPCGYSEAQGYSTHLTRVNAKVKSKLECQECSKLRSLLSSAKLLDVGF